MITQTLYLVLTPFSDTPRIKENPMKYSEGYTLLAEHEVTLPLPVFDATALRIKGMEDEITRTEAESYATVTALRGAIQELLAITYQPEEDV